MPKISVLMSAYNSEKYIAETINSVLSQTFTDFEFIIINDGSTDNTENIINSFKDLRIKYYSQTNQGVSKSLNKGLRIATGKYIAKIDSDDICFKDRLSKQYTYMEQNPSCVLCGSYADIIDESGAYIYTYSPMPTDNEEIKLKMETQNCFIHSTSFYRKDMALKIGGYYEPIKQYFEDYMFFYQLVKQGTVYNFSESLIKYRVSPGAISSRVRNKKYEALVKNVIHRGFIKDDEKEFLFSFRARKANKKLQLSNHYLTLSRLVLIYQNDFKRSIKLYIKAIIAKPLNVNIIISGLYLLLIIIKKKLKITT